jgi:tRNA-2-methylthio-N6-dimethylallyladenosine synthase
VPYTRGAEYSRAVAQIEAEARRLVDLGVREITLLGQNVNAYHGAGEDGEVWGLGRLIRRLARIDGLKRLRYMTSHPRDMDDDLIAAHADEEKLMPYLHLPVQAGSDAVLEAMNRGHTASDYRRLVARIRAARPDIALSSDFIVGFPGEDEAAFGRTLGVVERAGITKAHVFPYSPRPGTGTAAADSVPAAVKKERSARLRRLSEELCRRRWATKLGSEDSVLVDRPGRGYGDDYTPWLVEAEVGAFVRARAVGLAEEGILAVAA